jgi:hypothetical protein
VIGTGVGVGGTPCEKHSIAPPESLQQRSGSPAGTCQPGGHVLHTGVGAGPPSASQTQRGHGAPTGQAGHAQVGGEGGGGGKQLGSGGQSHGGQGPPAGHAQAQLPHPDPLEDAEHTVVVPSSKQHVPGEPAGSYCPAGHAYEHPGGTGVGVGTGGGAIQSPDPSSEQHERGSGYVEKPEPQDWNGAPGKTPHVDVFPAPASQQTLGWA